MESEDCISFISKSIPEDPRTLSWKHRVIIDTIQEFEPVSISFLLKTINSEHQKKHRCSNELFTYNALYGIILNLAASNIIAVNDKLYSISPEFTTTKTKYLPISSYCVFIFTLSVVFLLYSIFTRNHITEAVIIVMVGAIYLIAQLLGVEFSINKGTTKK